MSERIGPETRAIIKAIEGLKPDKENLNYLIQEIDLAVARSAALGNDEISLPGWFKTFTVGVLTGAATIRINDRNKNPVDLAWVRTLKIPISKLFLTNDAQPGCNLIFALGGEAGFSSDPVRVGRKVFTYEMLDEDGALNLFETSQIKTVLPTFMFNQGRDPIDLKEGQVNRIRLRLNPTNAVTYTFRLWRAAVNGAVTPYLQELACIYEMDFVGADDIAYTIVMERPLRLAVAGQLWYSIEWTGAPGNTPGSIEVQGEMFR